jgi:hypothetical protein
MLFCPFFVVCGFPSAAGFGRLRQFDRERAVSGKNEQEIFSKAIDTLSEMG